MRHPKPIFLIILSSLVFLTVACNMPQPCVLKHYVESAHCRHAKYFSEDTLSLEGLVWRYFNLVDGDTIVVKGYLNPYRYSEEIPPGCFANRDDYMNNRYLCDNPPEADTINYAELYERTLDPRFMSFYQGQQGHGTILFFERLHLFVIPDSSLWEFSDTTKMIVRGIFHITYLLDEVNGCEEVCSLESIDYSPVISK